MKAGIKVRHPEELKVKIGTMFGELVKVHNKPRHVARTEVNSCINLKIPIAMSTMDKYAKKYYPPMGSKDESGKEEGVVTNKVKREAYVPVPNKESTGKDTALSHLTKRIESVEEVAKCGDLIQLTECMNIIAKVSKVISSALQVKLQELNNAW